MIYMLKALIGTIIYQPIYDKFQQSFPLIRFSHMRAKEYPGSQRAYISA